MIVKHSGCARQALAGRLRRRIRELRPPDLAFARAIAVRPSDRRVSWLCLGFYRGGEGNGISARKTVSSFFLPSNQA